MHLRHRLIVSCFAFVVLLVACSDTRDVGVGNTSVPTPAPTGTTPGDAAVLAPGSTRGGPWNADLNAGTGGDTGTGDGGDALASDAGSLRPPPTFHRAVANVCPPSPVPPLDYSNPDTNVTCSNNADCTAHPNGSCRDDYCYFPTMRCYYDECLSDSDCPGVGVCECNVPLSVMMVPTVNRCFTGDCRVDADCERGQFCVMNRDMHQCNVPTGSYHCTTPSDECHDDIDCGPAGENGILLNICAYTKGAWRCIDAADDYTLCWTGGCGP